MQYPENEIRLEKNAIPFDEIRRVAGILPYGTSLSCMFKILAVTGCRLQELEVFRKSLLYRHPSREGWGVIHWKCGKNQPGYRSETLPKCLLDEIELYRQNNNVPEDRLFSLTSSTFQRYFRFFRQRLGGLWTKKVKLPYRTGNKVKSECFYNLGGLRKSFATLVFAKELRKWKDAGVALEMTSKRLKHSTVHMTTIHYLRNFDDLHISKYLDSELWQIYNFPTQSRLNSDFIQPLQERPLCAFT